MYASSPSVDKPNAAARILARLTRGAFAYGACAAYRAVACGAIALVAACHDAPTTVAPGQQDVRLALNTSILANPGAVLVAELSFTSGEVRQPLARDSVVITTGSVDTQMQLTTDVSPCVLAATTSGSTCTVNLALTLKRDGRILDESTQQFPITATTQTVAVPSTQLFEVATVAVDTVGNGALEPGDTKTLVAVARDRSGVVVPNRNPAWSLVSGGVTVTPAGSLTA
ncbi:MAG: hypothetical protein H7Z40_09670, partial [Phycisphaerae bacterium]|nr:hypothetical protein [Gemmatimonadaceae bacterium]